MELFPISLKKCGKPCVKNWMLEEKSGKTGASWSMISSKKGEFKKKNILVIKRKREKEKFFAKIVDKEVKKGETEPREESLFGLQPPPDWVEGSAFPLPPKRDGSAAEVYDCILFSNILVISLVHEVVKLFSQFSIILNLTAMLQ